MTRGGRCRTTNKAEIEQNARASFSQRIWLYTLKVLTIGFLSGVEMVFDWGSTFGRSHRSNIRSLLARCLCASSIGVVAYITRFIMVHRGLVYL